MIKSMVTSSPSLLAGAVGWLQTIAWVGVWVGGCGVWAINACGQPAGDPAIITAGTKLELLWNEGEFTEGVAVAGDGQVYFSDIAMSGKNPGRIMKFDPGSSRTSIHVADSGQSNGLFFNSSGKLLACCGANVGLRALCEVTTDGKMKILVDRFEGNRFNAPNDLVVTRTGQIYFSDPRYVGKESLDLKHQSVYRFANGQIERVTNDIAKPNGLMVSPDGKTLYVAETDNGATGLEPAGTPAKPGRYTLNAFSIHDDGSLGSKVVLVNYGDEPGVDGMTVDQSGNIYAAVRKESRHGIAVYQPQGKEIAFVPTEPLPTNCTFGKGADAKTLYITAGSGLYRIKLNVPGYHPELASK